MHAWGGVFPNLGRDDTCVIYTRQFFSAGNLLSSETSIIRLYGTHFYLHRAVATLRITDCLDVLCLFCFRTCFLLFLALVTQSYLGPSASLPAYVNSHTPACWQGLMISRFLLDGSHILILYASHHQNAYTCGYTLDIALEISIFVLKLALLLFYRPHVHLAFDP